MRLAVMQPYFFPYIGYFQLMAAVDRLVILDDVNFIKQGWINRNRILVGCRPFMFTIPVKRLSSFRSISDTRLALVEQSRQKLLKTIEQAYSRAPYFDPIHTLIKGVCESESEFVGKLALESILTVANYIGIDTRIIPTSSSYRNDNLSGVERILDICSREGSTEYYNLPGGMELYDRATFAKNGIELRFVQPKQMIYHQFNCPFVPRLSIIDVMMFNSKKQLASMLDEYELV